METVLKVSPWIILIVVHFIVLPTIFKIFKRKQSIHLSNDLRNEYKRWEYSEIAIAGFVSIYLEDSIRLDDCFKSLIYSVLKRSPRAIDEKMRRISLVGRSEIRHTLADEDIVYLLAKDSKEDGLNNFISNLHVVGASRKQISEIKKYL
tara:strand:+ start:538 stop:984 length:447 start_codon:yes stop_codon:yes gene_type:complete